MTSDSLTPAKVRLAPRVAFYVLMAFVTLYITLFSMGGTLFLLIERWLPDVTDYTFGSDAAIRNFLAALIVALPAYILTNHLFNKAARQNPSTRKAGTWKWLTYITLFIAACIVLGNLITLVYNLLNGEITPRFILKVVTLFVLAGGTFAYYFWDAREDGTESSAYATLIPRIYVYALLGLGLLVTITGLSVTASPATAKKMRQDAIRIEHLRSIKIAVDAYGQLHNRTLPAQLSNNIADFNFVTFPTDPVTNQPYEYRRGDAGGAYELCATFEASSLPVPNTRGIMGPYDEGYWKHAVGRTCFPFTLPAEGKPVM